MYSEKEQRHLKRLGERIRKVRKELGLSCYALCMKTMIQKEDGSCNMVSKATLSVIETGKSNLKYLTLLRITQALDVKLEDIVRI